MDYPISPVQTIHPGPRDLLGNPHLEQRLNQFGYVVSMGSCSYPTAHWHSGIEILVVHRGVVELDLGDRRTSELVSGSVAAYLSEQIHVTHPCGGNYVRTALHLLPDVVTSSPALELISQIRQNGVWQPASLRPDSMRRFLWCINELNALSRRYDAGVTYRQLLELILTDVYSSGTGTPSPPVLRQVIDYMQTHLAVRESMTTVASRFFISERHLTRMFHQHLNTTPQEYWLRLRISKACEMLGNATPIADVAYSIGFSSLSGFQRAFKKELGLSPSQYQEQVL